MPWGGLLSHVQHLKISLLDMNAKMNYNKFMYSRFWKNRDLFEAEGISDYIVKPFDTENFVARVDAIVKGVATAGKKEVKKTVKAVKVKKAKKAKKTIWNRKRDH